MNDKLSQFWFLQFKNGNECIEDEQSQGHTKSCSYEEMH